MLATSKAIRAEQTVRLRIRNFKLRERNVPYCHKNRLFVSKSRTIVVKQAVGAYGSEKTTNGTQIKRAK